jgi:NADH-quinone oxidoreductase subunit H
VKADAAAAAPEAAKFSLAELLLVEHSDIVLILVKVLFAVLMMMNVAVLLTWADRRQGAMIADRIGPNRAVIWLPTWFAQGGLVAPAAGLAGLVLFLAFGQGAEGAARTTWAILLSQAAIFLTWFTGIVIAGRVSARGARTKFDLWIQSVGGRNIAFIGLGAHGLAFLLGSAFRGTEFGASLRDFGFGGGAALLAAVALGGAGYAAYAIRREKRVGLRLAGTLHAAADGLKTLWKEDFIPPGADRLLHSIAPMISFFPALVVFAVIPFGDTLCFGTDAAGHVDLRKLFSSVDESGVCTTGAVPLQVANLNIGLLFFFAIAGTGIVGAALAGWASNNKYSLLGGLRAASQMVSYEVALGLTTIGALMMYGSLRLDRAVIWQSEHAWGIFVQPLAFFLFFAAAVAESKRIPFDLPEGESEIVAGYFTEYAGMKFAMFFFSEYIAVVSSSALMVTLFLGGWHLPFLDRDGLRLAFGGNEIFFQALPHGLVILLGLLGFLGKTIALCWLQLTIRWTLPRFRYDQLMRLGWRKLLPASLVNILATGLVILVAQSIGGAAERWLGLAGELTMALVALAGIAAAVWFFVFMLTPPNKRKLLATTSAQFAAALGGTRTSRMSA